MPELPDDFVQVQYIHSATTRDFTGNGDSMEDRLTMLRPGNKISQRGKATQWVISLSFALLFCGVVSIFVINTMSSARAMPYSAPTTQDGGRVNGTPPPSTFLTPAPTPKPEQTPTPDVSIRQSTTSGEDTTPTSGSDGNATPTPDNGNQTPQPVLGEVPTALPTRTAPLPAIFPGLPSTGSDPRGVALP